ncbi:WD repeat domain phosphoinositide-interacting protein 1-like, partial [Mantella aurantiaca]
MDPQDGGECFLINRHSLLDFGGSGKDREGSSEDMAPSSYAATVARPSHMTSSSMVTGYSEDGGALRGELLPEHEFAVGPVQLDDEREFPP